MEWPSGEATACKAVHTGSNPVSTSLVGPNLLRRCGIRTDTPTTPGPTCNCHATPQARDLRAATFRPALSGSRYAIAASLIDSADRIVVLVDDDYDHAEKLGLTT